MSTGGNKPKSIVMIVATSAIVGGAVVAGVAHRPNTSAPPITQTPSISASPAPTAMAKPALESKTFSQERKVRTESTRAINETAPSPSCAQCGVVESIEKFTSKGQASGGGAVAGGVLGAVVGNQMGEGRGKDVATILGAVGGAVAGNEIERNTKKTLHYRVTVRMDHGHSEKFTFDAVPSFETGESVKIVKGRLVRG